MSEQQKRDLVLPPGAYAYMQDVTKGVVKTYTGPTVINPTAQERPVVYDAAKGTFRSAGTLEEAMRIAPVAAEGHYLILRNPARGNKHPEEGSAQPSADLEIGRTIIVPGPATFALWPGQAADVVEGHHLRSNQYLLVRIYNEDEARRNWSQAVVKPAAPDAEAGGPAAPQPVSKAPPPDLTVGKQLIIRGTEVSFYIPPTGVEVVPEQSDGKYAREALTLERLEYAILVDENGKKRYEVGPQVVFPLPTERFVEAKDDAGRPSKKFRAVELNEIQGLHIKVIADYTEGDRTHRAGDELFITGKDTAIYFPREEHSAIKYDGKAKHFATAIPAGDARYVMNRLTGAITTVRGPAMLLPDPRTEVIVRRVLADRECALWYPSNQEALEYNRSIRALLLAVPTTRQGVLSEGDVERGQRRGAGAKGVMSTPSPQAVMEASRVSGDQALIADEFTRASTYTQPRTITLDSKYQGAPLIAPWTGYAVMITSKTGKRRVEVGPSTVLLDYDEGLEAMSLSTGLPKSTARRLETAYLRIENNLVSDLIEVVSQDHVAVDLGLAYRVSFEGDPMKWFAVDNYVQLLCDHVRSLLTGEVRRRKVEALYDDASGVVRDIVLGGAIDGARPGLAFAQNGMRVIDVEVLAVAVKDEQIRTVLEQARHEVVRATIGLEATRRREQLARDEAEVRAETARKHDELALELAASALATTLAKLGNAQREVTEKQRLIEAEQVVEDVKLGARLERVKREREQELAFLVREQEKRIELLRAEAETAVQRFQAASGNFSEALLALSRNETLVKVAQAWDVQRLIEGESLGDTLKRLFSATPLKPLVDQLVPPTNGEPKPAPTR